MAKFSRYDPRNKKRNRNKNLSMEKDFRIKKSLKSEDQDRYYLEDDIDEIKKYEIYKDYIK